jgi:hypothetical protein
MTTATGSPTNDTAGRTVQVHRVYITAPAQRVWDALLSPEWSDRYGYGGFVQSDLTRLTVTHDLTDAPNLAVMTSGQADDQPGGGGGGWPWVLSDLKSLLETGTAFSRPS